MATLVGDFRLPVDPNDLAAKGLSGALRYWAKQGGSSTVVGITASEVAAYRTAKKPLGTIYEARSPTWMSGGGAAGQQAARWLLTQFKAADWTPSTLYLAADANTLSSKSINECMDGAAQALGFMPDLYAFLPQLQGANGHMRHAWLTGHFPGASIAEVQRDYPWLGLYQCQGSQPAGIPTSVTITSTNGELVTGDVDIVLRKDWNGTTMTSPIDKLTDAQVQTIVQASQNWLIGNQIPGTPAGALSQVLFAVKGEISDEQAAVIAAVANADADAKAGIAQVISALGTAGGTDVGALASALAPLLNQNQGAQLIAALRQVFDQASA